MNLRLFRNGHTYRICLVLKFSSLKFSFHIQKNRSSPPELRFFVTLSCSAYVHSSGRAYSMFRCQLCHSAADRSIAENVLLLRQWNRRICRICLHSGHCRSFCRYHLALPAECKQADRRHPLPQRTSLTEKQHMAVGHCVFP